MLLVTGRAQKALHLLPEATRSTYAATKARFDPESRHTLYQAKFQAHGKKFSEQWADFVNDLKILADKGHLTLQEEAREQLAVNAYLQHHKLPLRLNRSAQIHWMMEWQRHWSWSRM